MLECLFECVCRYPYEKKDAKENFFFLDGKTFFPSVEWGGSECHTQYSIQYNVLERDDDKLNETLQAITVREMGNVLKTDIGAIFWDFFLLYSP